jgi:lysosomal acid lipase/cholesteryl ester hydrolase
MMLALLPTSLLLISAFVVRKWNFPLNRKFTTLTCVLFDYSWHEMGVYDLPAIIDYILEVSEQHSLYYVAHSMGCTMFFVLTSTLPHYNSKFRIMFGFGPAVFNSHIRNKIFRISEFSKVGVSHKHFLNFQ